MLIMAFKILVIWLVILLFAILNGGFREFVLTPNIGLTNSLIISGLLLSVVIFVITYIVLSWLNSRKSSFLLLVGVIWLSLTIAFEFTFGLAQGKTLASLLEAYMFKDGNIWPIVLVVITFSPRLAAWLKWRV